MVSQIKIPETDIGLDMRGITKRFPGVIAADQVNFFVRKGEVHGLLGENGAGKTTLMSILCGLYMPDDGEIFLGSREGTVEKVHIGSPRKAIELGIGMVHQHFRLVQSHTVAENCILGLSDKKMMIDRKEISDRITGIGDRYRIHIESNSYVWQLSIGEQQRVEILKMLYRNADILILDEPTAVLTPLESQELGRTLRTMAKEGKAVVFISHKLDEVMAFTDRVTVLRNGKNVKTVETKNTDKERLANLMVGRNVVFASERPVFKPRNKLLEVTGVTAQNDKGVTALVDVTFSVKSGEILGVAGVSGNGQQELAEVLTGLRKSTDGTVKVGNVDLTNKAADKFIANGVGHIPGDRIGVGLAGNLSVSDNLIMKAFRGDVVSKGIFLRHDAIRDYSNKLIQDFDVDTPHRKTPVRNLSGGNQQKAILAREIMARAEQGSGDNGLLVAVQPTRGLDVGATEAVRRLLLAQCEQGNAVLLISDDLDEILSVSTNIAVMFSGKIMGIVDGDNADISEIGIMMAGGDVNEI
tara:strand:+ start:7 stop:1584 length:1578 start_codon:yes stop_codon:yes gene_type:complete